MTSDPEQRVETTISLEVPSGYREGGRLDRYITRFIENASRTRVQDAIAGGMVTVNDRVVDKAAHTVQAGDRIVCRVPRPPPIEARPEDIPVDVVYEDDDLLVVNKPAGMVVHPAYGNRTGTLVNALLHYVGGGTLSVDEDDEDWEDEDVGLSTVGAAPSAAGDPSIRPGIVHRLDKDTSGLLVVAKNDVAHRALALQFQERTTRRRYLALVWGVPDPACGRVETHLGRDRRDRKRMAVVPVGQGKHAVTHYEVEEAFTYTALVAFRLETGRTHQIRVHAQQMGHPVIGDETYGGASLRYGPHTASRKSFFRNLFDVMPRQALHAQTLGFIHPRSGEQVDFTSDLPTDMAHVLAQLRRVEG